MRRVVVVFALIMAAGAASAASGRPPVESSHERAAAPVAVQGIGLPFAGIRDEAAMVLVGTVLIGLAAAVRRAV